MRVGIIGIVVVGLVFLGSSFCLANGGGPVEEKTGIVEEEVIEPIIPEVQVPVPEITRAGRADLKSPGLATLLSFICPGLGQLYNEDGVKALLMGSGEALSWILIGVDLDELGIFGLAIGRVISPVDAYYSAIEKNEGISLIIDNDKVLLAMRGSF